MGAYDHYRRRLRRGDGKYGGGDGGRIGFGKGGGLTLHHDDRRDVVVGGTDGNRKGCGYHRIAEPETESVFNMVVSGYSEGASGKGAYLNEYCRESAGAWLGMYARGIKGDGGAAGAACGKLQTQISGELGGARALRFTRNVYLSCFEYFFAAIDSREYDRVQESVRERKSGGYYRTSDHRNISVHRGGTDLCGDPRGTGAEEGGVVRGEGCEAGRLNSPFIGDQVRSFSYMNKHLPVCEERQKKWAEETGSKECGYFELAV